LGAVLMKGADCHRIWQSTIFYCKSNIIHSRRQRLLSTISENFAQPVAGSNETSHSPLTADRPKYDDVRTSGPTGSPDYIPRKRGYAPNIPIPAHKFTLPTKKTGKGIPDPEKLAPEPKPRPIKSIAIEYERQLNAMRRGYVRWRYNHLQEKSKSRQIKRNLPPAPGPPPFELTFAEKMAAPSNTDQSDMENKLLGRFIHSPQKIRGAGYQSKHHQATLARKRKVLINEYLALYHTSREFITTEEDLDRAIMVTFPQMYGGRDVSVPQSYQSILRDIQYQGGTSSLDDGGYVANMASQKETEMMDAIFGTVADGNPGYDEVMREIQEAMENETRLSIEAPEEKEAVVDVEPQIVDPERLQEPSLETIEADTVSPSVEPSQEDAFASDASHRSSDDTLLHHPFEIEDPLFNRPPPISEERLEELRKQYFLLT
jgi:hypothetical protein